MTHYPYAPPEQYPQTRERERYRAVFNTRVIRGQVPTLGQMLLKEWSVQPLRCKPAIAVDCLRSHARRIRRESGDCRGPAGHRRQVTDDRRRRVS
jgi:hypothetical protein